VGPLQNFTYLVANEEGGEGVVIDPSFQIDPVLEAIDARRVKVRYILNTHSHRDHIAGNADIRERTGAKVVAHRTAPLDQDLSVADGDVVESGRIRFEVVHTPGHTQDTLFVGEAGWTENAEQSYDSLLRRIVQLDDALVVLPGHDYGVTPTSTIGREKRENYVLQPRTREEFVRFMKE
jgi:glyoxylase-like metal-dependent hydrolase (beta-lactamase superfamily II)